MFSPVDKYVQIVKGDVTLVETGSVVGWK